MRLERITWECGLAVQQFSKMASHLVEQQIAAEWIADHKAEFSVSTGDMKLVTAIAKAQFIPLKTHIGQGQSPMVR